MTEQTDLTTVQPGALVPAEWGDKEAILALGNRFKAMMPGKLSASEALLLAQYSAAMGANPFRGEVYAYASKGKLILVEGYKLLVRWARRQCQFYERYERLTNDTDTIPEGALAFRCRILRQDAVADMARLANAGVPNAYEICSTEAVGVVTKDDTWSKNQNKPIPPPKGWTWEAVARKRALKNALNRAYGAPSPKEVADETWMVDDVETVPKDWEDITPEMTVAERDATARYSARRRLSPPAEPKTFAEAMDELGFPIEEPDTELLFDSAIGDATLSEKPPEPEVSEGTGQSLDSPAETPQEGAGDDGLERLLEDVNKVLIEKVLDTYNHTKHIKHSLKLLGYTKYKPSLHEEMIEHLVEHKMPPIEPPHPEEIPF